MTTVAVCQVQVDIADVEANRRRVVAAVEEAVRGGADVVVLPELVTCGYVFADAAEARSRAEDVSGPTLGLFRQLSGEYGVVLVAGWCEESGLERPYNSAVILDGGELVANYRKTHLWGREKLVFTAGSVAPPVTATSVGQLAVLVCYDLEFPELTRSAALRGAQLVVAPVNWPAGPGPAGQHPVEVTKALAAAGVNRMVVAVADRCGPERDVDWIGASLIASHEGYLLAGPATGGPTVLLAEVDLAAATDKRLGDHNDSLADRRPELY